MAPITFRGHVFYRPGPWGNEVPVGGASVRIVDVDTGGDGSDIIWMGTTNANGEIEGTTEEWMDPNTRGSGLRRQRTPELLVLKALISQGENHQELLIKFSEDLTTFEPLVVAWNPSGEKPE